MINYNGEKTVKTEKAVKTSAEVSQTYTQANQSTEDKLKKILSKVDGVGEVDVFINYKDNSETSDSSVLFNERQKNNYDKNKVEGIIIVAQGGGDAKIISMIRNSVSESFGIPIHKVVVLKMSE